MKQRLGLAAALLRPRDLLVLDEPTNGLDPQGTREVRHLVRELAEAGTTVLVSSHLLAEIEQVCSHVGIMSRGRLLLQGDRGELHRAAALPGSSCQTSADHVGAVAEVLTGLGLTECRVDGHDGRPRCSATPRPRRSPPRSCTPASTCSASRSAGPNLEQIFVELTGEGFDVAR